NRATHAGKAIVNSENPQMGWGGGISGEISTKLGTKASQEVDRERQELRDKFNSLIEEKEKVKCDECQKDLGKDFACGNPFNESKDLKLCSKCYSDLTILHGKFKGYEISRNGNSSIIVYDGKKTEKKDKKTPEEWQEELKKVDNNIKKCFTENKVKE